MNTVVHVSFQVSVCVVFLIENISYMSFLYGLLMSNLASGLDKRIVQCLLSCSQAKGLSSQCAC